MTQVNKTSISPGGLPADSKAIGARISKDEWTKAAKRVGGDSGRIYLPKANGEYAGKVLYVTDTHLIQQVGRNAAVAHDLTKLENKNDLLKLEETGKLDKSTLKVKYGENRGTAEVVPFNVQRANEVKKQAQEWAEKNLTNSKSRDSFTKHIENFTQDMAKGGNQYQTTKTPPAVTQEVQKAAPMLEKVR